MIVRFQFDKSIFNSGTFWHIIYNEVFYSFRNFIRKYQFVTENAGGLSEKKWRTMWQELALEKKARKEKYSDC